MNTPRTRTRRGAAILFSGVLVFGGLALASEASAVRDVGDNPTCEYLGFTYGNKWDDNPPAGTYTLDRDGVEASFTVGTYTDKPEPNPNNAITAYSVSTLGDYAIIVKGGDGATVYDPGAQVPLHAPAVASGKWPTISHFDLCWNKPTTEPEVGQLEVTKVVTGEGAPTIEYEICIEGPAPATAKECLTVTGAGVVTFKGLEPGAYKVTETNPGSAYTVTITPTDTITVTAGGVAKATVTNTYKAPPPPPPPPPPQPPKEEVTPPTVQALPPTAPATPVAPVTPATAVEVAAAPTALPSTGSEGGLAAIAAILVTMGLGLTLLGKRRGTQQA